MNFKFVKNKSKNLIVNFNSGDNFFYRKENLKKFELEKSFKKNKINSDLLFIKDSGIIKYGYSFYLDEIENIKKLLVKKIKNYSFVVFNGISVGGYAAILYGSLLEVDVVISVNGQTCLLDFQTLKFIDKEKYLLKRKLKDFKKVKKYFNLKNFINTKTEYYHNGWYYFEKERPTYLKKFLNNKEKFLNYKNLSPIGKLHCYYQHENIEKFKNVHYLNFMKCGFKNGRFFNLLKKINKNFSNKI